MSDHPTAADNWDGVNSVEIFHDSRFDDVSADDKMRAILIAVAEKGRMSAYSPGYTKLKEKPVDISDALAQLRQLLLQERLNELLPLLPQMNSEEYSLWVRTWIVERIERLQQQLKEQS